MWLLKPHHSRNTCAPWQTCTSCPWGTKGVGLSVLLYPHCTTMVHRNSWERSICSNCEFFCSVEFTQNLYWTTRFRGLVDSSHFGLSLMTQPSCIKNNPVWRLSCWCEMLLLTALPSCSPWIPECKFKLHGNFQVQEDKGIGSSQFLALIHPLEQFLRQRSTWICRPSLPWILVSELHMLTVWESCTLYHQM